jgi:hypothetical protein
LRIPCTHNYVNHVAIIHWCHDGLYILILFSCFYCFVVRGEETIAHSEVGKESKLPANATPIHPASSSKKARKKSNRVSQMRRRICNHHANVHMYPPLNQCLGNVIMPINEVQLNFRNHDDNAIHSSIQCSRARQEGAELEPLSFHSPILMLSASTPRNAINTIKLRRNSIKEHHFDSWKWDGSWSISVTTNPQCLDSSGDFLGHSWIASPVFVLTSVGDSKLQAL